MRLLKTTFLFFYAVLLVFCVRCTSGNGMQGNTGKTSPEEMPVIKGNNIFTADIDNDRIYAGPEKLAPFAYKNWFGSAGKNLLQRTITYKGLEIETVYLPKTILALSEGGNSNISAKELESKVQSYAGLYQFQISADKVSAGNSESDADPLSSGMWILMSGKGKIREQAFNQSINNGGLGHTYEAMLGFSSDSLDASRGLNLLYVEPGKRIDTLVFRYSPEIMNSLPELESDHE